MGFSFLLPLAMMTPYAKSLDDELDWKRIDQLYGVVTQMSAFCFEIKKFCVTTEFVILTLLAKMTGGTLDHAFFVAGFAIPLCFWFLDAVAYFYQVKMRGAMDAMFERVRDRNRQHVIDADGGQVIATERLARSAARRVFDAVFNHSMWIYVMMLFADVMAWKMLAVGWTL